MGFRFRKSITIIPGIKLNIGAKSAGISIGGKYGGVSLNTKTGARVRASAPGTGISYSEKISTAPAKPKIQEQRNYDLEEAQNYVRIIHESAQICKDTTNPEVFFSRCDLLGETARKLYNMRNKVSLSPQIFEAINLLDSGESSHIEEFINRYFTAQYEDAKNLKTPKGRLNRLQKAYDSLMKYQDKMNDGCLTLVSDLYNEYTRKLGSNE